MLIVHLTKLDVICCSQLRLAHDGLEREFKSFNWLEGGVCTTCAPGDQERCHYANVSRLVAHVQGLNFRGQEAGEYLRAVSAV